MSLTAKQFEKLPKYAQAHIQQLVNRAVDLESAIEQLTGKETKVSFAGTGSKGFLPDHVVVRWKTGETGYIEIYRDSETGGVYVRTNRSMVVKPGGGDNVVQIINMPHYWHYRVSDPDRWATIAALMEASKPRVWVCENCGATQQPDGQATGDPLPCCDKPSLILQKGEANDERSS